MDRRLVGVLAVAAGLGLSACDHGGAPPAASTVPGSHAWSMTTEEYLPGVAADLYLPDHGAAAPVVVLVPGGAWRTADRGGLVPLAESLATAGMVVANATYRAADAGVVFPTEVRDVVCSVDFTVARARDAGLVPGPIVVLGHSSGAHLAALAALAGDHFRADCPYPPSLVSAFVGLAGLYDVTAMPGVAEPLFGVPPAENADRWREGNALTWAGSRTTLPVFLGHGDADRLVPLQFTVGFADALRRAGHPVHLEIVPGAGHQEIYRAEVIGPTLAKWINSGAAA